jgi:hypothetical protein
VIVIALVVAAVNVVSVEIAGRGGCVGSATAAATAAVCIRPSCAATAAVATTTANTATVTTTTTTAATATVTTATGSAADAAGAS